MFFLDYNCSDSCFKSIGKVFGGGIENKEVYLLFLVRMNKNVVD